MTDPFQVKSSTIAAIATGEHAISLIGFRDKLITIPLDSIYHHFWGMRLFPRLAQPEYHNDFAMWVHQALNDEVLAEKLSILDPTEYASLEDLRADMLEIIEKRLDDYEILAVARREDMFYFVRSSIIIFDTPYSIVDPIEIPKVIPTLSPGSFFYHFIDAKTRTPEKWNDLSTWLATYGETYLELIEELNAIDPYFLSLSTYKERIIAVVNRFFHTDSDSQQR